MLQVQLVDDHEVVRKGIRRLLEDSGRVSVICESSSGESGFQDYCRHKPDVLLLDLAMPGGDGMGLLKQLMQKYPDSKVLVLSMYDDVVFPKRALALGAHGYVSKGASAEVLLEAVSQVAKGNRYVEPRIAQGMVLQSAQSDGPASVLTPREFEVFSLLAQGDSVSSIASVLHLSPKTVGTHRTNILRKLGARNAADLARLAVRHGLIIA